MKGSLKNKLLIITGTYPPGICGAGDYTQKLMQTNIADNWQIYCPANWRMNTLFKKITEINNTKIESINLQYPTMGYKGSLLPHLLCIFYSVFTKKKFSVTIHESSQLSLKAKIGTYILFIFANKVVFTNIFELQKAAKFIPFLQKKCRVIKIYTNIESDQEINKIEEREYDLVYFGLIRPQKGLEDFIKVAKELKVRNSKIKIIIAGKIQPENIEYANKQLVETKTFLFKTFYNKEEKQIAQILSNCKIAYLPFPDGISERRGSALAVLKTGGLVVTTKGPFTTKNFDNCCEFIDSSKDAVLKIEEMLSKSIEYFKLKQDDVKQFLDNNFPKSWQEVANEYLDFLKL